MTKHTKRDKIWSAAIHLSKDGKFTVKEVLSEAGLEESSERTARDVLITMNDLGHLERALEDAREDSQWYDSEKFPIEGRNRVPWSNHQKELEETHHKARRARKAHEMWAGD